MSSLYCGYRPDLPGPFGLDETNKYCYCPIPVPNPLESTQSAILFNEANQTCQCPIQPTYTSTEVQIIWNPTLAVCNCPAPNSYSSTEVALVLSPSSTSCVCPSNTSALNDLQVLLILSPARQLMYLSIQHNLCSTSSTALLWFSQTSWSFV
jgi:hypothetical protein